MAKDRETLVGRVRALEEAVELTQDRIDDQIVADGARVVKQVDRRLAVSGDATVVALAGATGSGKSTTFNAVSGSDLATPGVKRPTTSQAMAVSWGDEAAAEELLDWLQIPRRHTLGAVPGFEGLVLLDLPDHDSTELKHRMEVDRLVQLVDMLIWVVDPQKYADAALHDRYLKPLRDHADVMMVVLNQIDRLSPDQADRCLRDMRALLDSEGLRKTEIMAISARTGQGVEHLRQRIQKMAREKAAAAKRLSADVTSVATRMREASGTAEAGRVPRQEANRLNKALAESAAVPVVTDAVAKAWRHRGGLATGWPALAWLARFRPDPLRKLHLDRLRSVTSGAAKPAEIDPARVSRTSLPQASGVQRARMDSALRALADESSAGLSRGWADAVKAAARSNERTLPDQLDRAIATTDLAMNRNNGWWTVVRVLQWVLIAAVVVGLVWFGVNFALAYFMMPPLPRVTWRNIPVPTLLVGGGVIAGLVLAGLSRIGVEVGARRKAARARSVLLRAIGDVSQDRIIAPVNAELDRYSRATSAIGRAIG